MAAPALRLNQKIFVRGLIVARTGLSIGGTDTGLGAGGADRVVIREPLSNQPYIPGSTLKGRMRSLLERLYGEFGPAPGGHPGGPVRKPELPETKRMCDLFGVPADDRTAVPGRLTVRDSRLLNGAALEAARELDLPYTELKTEVTIDRITARTTPHHYERVPAGAVFGLDVVVTAWHVDGHDDDVPTLLRELFTGMRLVQDDALGACGSRGYGKVEFHVKSVTTRDRASYLNGGQEQPVAGLTVPDDLQLPADAVAALGV
ncbi:MAG: type III-A CRISPR-associated RAMP protein Csm3 [Planctomycetota bacterium]